MKKVMPKSRLDLEDFVKSQGLHPYGVVSYRGRDIFLAETDLETDKPIEYPWGYYQAAWFVTSPNSNEKLDGGSWGEYSPFHDSERGWTQEERRQARIRDMIDKAQKWIDANIDKGRYDA